MQISIDSWHYKLIDILDFNHPDNLCAYFWKTVWTIIFVSFMIFGVILFVGAPLWNWLTTDFPVPILVIGLILDVFLAGLLIYGVVLYFELLQKVMRVLPKRKPKPPKIKKPPGLFRQWLSAKHRKVCPLLKFN